MTNHEAIQFLNNMIDQEHGRSIGAEGFYRELCAYHVDALRMAIKALEQEPKFIAKSDGTIEQIKNCDDCLFKKEWEKIGKLISVVLEKQNDAEYHGTEDMDGLYYCPICQQTTTVVKDGKCPKCGATMDELSTREQTEDAISRQATLEPYKRLKDTDTLCVALIRANIMQQPSIKPQEPPKHTKCDRCPYGETKVVNICNYDGDGCGWD